MIWLFVFTCLLFSGSNGGLADCKLTTRIRPNFTANLAEIHYSARKKQFSVWYLFIDDRYCMIPSSEPLAFRSKRIASTALVSAIAAAAFSASAQTSPGNLESNTDGIEPEAQETEIEV